MADTHTSHQSSHPNVTSLEIFLEATARLMLPESKVPKAITRKIEGERYSIRYFVEPNPEGEKLIGAVLHLPPTCKDDISLLTLYPFPQGEAAEKLHNLLKDAKASGTKLGDILPALEELGKEANGVGWINDLADPLSHRENIPPFTYLAPSLKMILNNDPSIGNIFASSRNTNGTHAVCIAQANSADAKVSFSFYRSEQGETPKLVREIDLNLPKAHRAAVENDPELLRANLLNLAKEFQTYFYSADIDFAISRIERFNVKFNNEEDLPPNATKDDRLRLMTTLRPPYEFNHRFVSGTVMAVEAGEEVIALVIQGPAGPKSSAYSALIDRAKLNVSDSEWAAIRQEFMDAIRTLASESEGLQAQAIERIVALTTQQARLPTPMVNILGQEATDVLLALVKHYGLFARSELGNSASEVRRICDGSETIAISRPTKKLSKTDVMQFKDLALEFKRNGDLEYCAQNLVGNQIVGRVSAAGIAAAGGRPRIAVYMTQMFCQQIETGERNPFETAVASVTALDPESSYHMTDGQSPFLDLPSFTDAEERHAFFYAGMFAKRLCETSRGHGRHRAGALGSGMAEAQLEFPRAPYDLVVRFHNNKIVRADFVPKPTDTGAPLTPYSFVGEIPVSSDSLPEMGEILDRFSEWGTRHSQKYPSIGPLEDTVAFKAMGRLLTKVE